MTKYYWISGLEYWLTVLASGIVGASIVGLLQYFF